MKLARTNQPKKRVIEATTFAPVLSTGWYPIGSPTAVASRIQWSEMRLTAVGTPTQILVREVVARKNNIRKIRKIHGKANRRKPAISRTIRLNISTSRLLKQPEAWDQK